MLSEPPLSRGAAGLFGEVRCRLHDVARGAFPVARRSLRRGRERAPSLSGVPSQETPRSNGLLLPDLRVSCFLCCLEGDPPGFRPVFGMRCRACLWRLCGKGGSYRHCRHAVQHLSRRERQPGGTRSVTRSVTRYHAVWHVLGRMVRASGDLEEHAACSLVARDAETVCARRARGACRGTVQVPTGMSGRDGAGCSLPCRSCRGSAEDKLDNHFHRAHMKDARQKWRAGRSYEESSQGCRHALLHIA